MTPEPVPTRPRVVQYGAVAQLLKKLGVVAADGPTAAMLGLFAAPLAWRPLEAVTTRTDGPALNGALAGTGVIFGLLAYALLSQAQPGQRLRQVGRLGPGHRMRRDPGLCRGRDAAAPSGGARAVR